MEISKEPNANSWRWNLALFWLGPNEDSRQG